MGSQDFVVGRHLRRMFGEGHPYMCDYMKELVESRRAGKKVCRVGVEKLMDSSWNGNIGMKSICSTFLFLPSPPLWQCHPQPPPAPTLCQALALSPLKAPLSFGNWK